jgi:hypothetical protein
MIVGERNGGGGFDGQSGVVQGMTDTLPPRRRGLPGVGTRHDPYAGCYVAVSGYGAAQDTTTAVQGTTNTCMVCRCQSLFTPFQIGWMSLGMGL